LIRTPISLLQSLTGGNLYHCGFCRIQFYDHRDRNRERASRFASAADQVHHERNHRNHQQ
jgi:hypothetical protein